MSALIQWSVRPCVPLAPFIDRLWGCCSAQPVSLPPLLPGTGSELLLHLATPPRLAEGAACNRGSTTTIRHHVSLIIPAPNN